jgi:hypothetical protein
VFPRRRTNAIPGKPSKPVVTTAAKRVWGRRACEQAEPSETPAAGVGAAAPGWVDPSSAGRCIVPSHARVARARNCVSAGEFGAPVLPKYL